MFSGRMESKTSNSSSSAEKRAKPELKRKILREKDTKEEKSKEKSQEREKLNKASLIPVLKGEKIDLKSIMKEPKPMREPFISPCCCPCSKKQEKNADYEMKLKLLEEKEKSIAEYLLKIEDTLRKLVVQKDQKECTDPVDPETTQNTFARKMTSDPEVFRKGKMQNKILSDFENNVEEISSIWLKTSADLFKTLKNLKKNPSLDPIEFEIENERIQVAIKQAKSLTLLKTKSVIAEAKKLYHHGEMIRSELENLLSHENVKLECGRCLLPQGEGQDREDSLGKKEADGTGDSTKQIPLESIKETNNNKGKEEFVPVKECTQEKEMSSGEITEKPSEVNQFRCTSSEMITEEVEALAAELSKKNETITNLNNRIFELQKSCNEHVHKFNQLQAVLSEFQEKIKWNQVLWKQIGKLKERIQGLQQSNKQLETHKRELETKIAKLDKELERLLKLNRLLNQKKCLMDAQECPGKNCRNRENEIKEIEEKCQKSAKYNDEMKEKILSDKQNAINQLRSVLGAMKDQENFAQKQIAMFQSKIEALEEKS